VFRSDGIVNYYLPSGKWTHFLTNKVVEGPTWIQEKFDFMSLPMMVRSNTVLPLGAYNDRPNYNYCDDITLMLYELDKQGEIEIKIPDLNGKIVTVFRFTYTESRMNIERTGESKAWNMIMVNKPTLKTKSAGEVEVTPKGLIIRCDANLNSLTLTF